MRRWLILGVLAALVLAVAWWFFLISPRNARIAEAQDELEAAQAQELELRGRMSRLEDIKEAEPEYLAGIRTMEALIPDQPLLDEFIDEIYELTGSTGVELVTIAPSQPVPITDSELRQITVAVSIDGEFYEVLGFLFGVMDMERLVRVDAIAISSSQDESGGTTLTVSLGLRLFTLADLLPVALPVDTGTGSTTTTVAGATTTVAGATTTVAGATTTTTTAGGG